MRQHEDNLPKLLMSKYPKEAWNPNLIMYTIALEAWRRGITVKFFTVYVKNQIKVRYMLSHQDKEYRFQLSLGDKATKDARNIGKSKDLTKKVLADANVPVPEGKVIDIIDRDYTEALTYVETLGYPIVVKPANASLGIGVRTNITNVEELNSALDYVHVELGYREIIIERFATGEDTRAYVAGDKVVAAYKRIPANVVGDNKHNIKELIGFKNEKRKRNPHASKHQIEVNDRLISFIKNYGYTLDSIPKEGEIVYFSKSRLHKDACEVVDITDEITEEYKRVAVAAVKALPGMNLCGVDIMMDDDKGTYYVLELNSRPNIGGHIFPVKGESRNVPGGIVDYYFPETISYDRGKNDYFTFDFDRIIDFLKKGIVKEVTLPALPKDDVVRKEILLTGSINRHKNWIFKKAIGLRLGGEIKQTKSKKATLQVAGERKHMDIFMEELEKKQSSKFKFEVLNEDKWDSVLMYKFESPAEFMRVENKKRTKTKVKTENSYKQLQKENEQLKKEILKLKESTSWKVTRPLRGLVKTFKSGK